MRRGRSLSYGLMGLVLAVGLAIGTFDAGGTRTVEERVQDVAATIRCPQCASQSSADSDSPAATAVREEIAERIDAGQSDDEIRAYFAGRFGDGILLTPPATGVGSLVWILPVVALVAGGAGLAWAFVRWRRLA